MKLCLLSVIVFQFLALSVQAGQAKNVLQKDIKAEITKLGIGSRVKVDLVNGSTLRGRILQIGTDSFSIEAGGSRNQDVAFSDVRQVKRAGGGLSKVTRNILIGVAIVTVASLVVGLSGDR